jgi:hypothetical protein
MEEIEKIKTELHDRFGRLGYYKESNDNNENQPS